ncbi:MAG TPA: hypothetical protein PLQ35_16455 [bacterium]|nr:hypothetical protein [bacterium]HQL63870.1 hypothetical protein [bacterium]
MGEVRCCFCGAPVKKKTCSETLCPSCEPEDDQVLVEVLMYLKSAKGRLRHIYEICAEVEGVTEKRIGRWKRLGWIKTRADGMIQIDDGQTPELDSHLRKYILNKMGMEEEIETGTEDPDRGTSRMVVVERLGLEEEDDKLSTPDFLRKLRGIKSPSPKEQKEPDRLID